MKDMILYHGSKNGLSGAIKPMSREKCDFGRGFYMGLHTISEEEAAERILTAYGIQDNYIKDMTEKNKVILKTRFCEP